MPEFVEQYSYLGLFFILFIEEGGVPLPVPGDIFIATVAALPSSNYLLTILTVILATLIGSTFLFTIARKFGRNLLKKYGKYIKLTPEKIKKVDKWFKKHSGMAIVIGRLIPGLRIVTPFVAGLFGISYKTFWLYTTVATLIWANIYFFIGKFLGITIDKLNLF